MCKQWWDCWVPKARHHPTVSFIILIASNCRESGKILAPLCNSRFFHYCTTAMQMPSAMDRAAERSETKQLWPPSDYSEAVPQRQPSVCNPLSWGCQGTKNAEFGLLGRLANNRLANFNPLQQSFQASNICTAYMGDRLTFTATSWKWSNLSFSRRILGLGK